MAQIGNIIIILTKMKKKVIFYHQEKKDLKQLIEKMKYM